MSASISKALNRPEENKTWKPSIPGPCNLFFLPKYLSTLPLCMPFSIFIFGITAGLHGCPPHPSLAWVLQARATIPHMDIFFIPFLMHWHCSGSSSLPFSPKDLSDGFRKGWELRKQAEEIIFC